MRKKKEYPKKLTVVEIKSEENHLKKINAKWKELEVEASKDLPNNNNKFVVTSHINQKWYSIKSDWRRQLIELDKVRKKLYREILEYYIYEHDRELSDTEKKLYVQSDSRYVHIHDKCERITGLLEYIDGVLESIKYKGYDLKNHIEYVKFMKGSID